MKRLIVVFAFGLVMATSAKAEDSVALFGNYYKERSTRVIAPFIEVTKDLPSDSELKVSYLVDQITSASAAFTASDEPFKEHRQEVGVAGKTRFGTLTPGLFFRFSTEPDYRSIGGGAELSLSLFEDNTVLSTFAQVLHDDVYQRGRPGLHDTLDTLLIGAGVTQVLAKSLLFGATLETQRLDGLQENLYRVENHPRQRRRYAASGWFRYFFDPSSTAARVAYRFYADDWEIDAHTLELELTQTITSYLELSGRFYYYTQSGVFFTTLSGDFLTSDPKLKPFGSRLYGGRLRLRLDFLEDTFLSPFSRSEVQPAYSYLDQDNSYGPAHIAQLGWYWPF